MKELNASSTFVYFVKNEFNDTIENKPFLDLAVCLFQLQTVRVYNISRLSHAKKSGLTNQQYN